MVAGEFGARDVVEVDLELAGREFLERRARRECSAPRRSRTGPRGRDRRPRRPPCCRTAGRPATLRVPGMWPTFGVGCCGLGLEQVELELGRGDGREPQVLQRLHGVPQHLARIGEERSALRVVHREQHLRGRHVRPGHRGEDPGTAVEIASGSPSRPPLSMRVEGHALGVEQHGRAAEVEPVLEGLRELAAHRRACRAGSRACRAAAARVCCVSGYFSRNCAQLFRPRSLSCS